MDSCLQRYGHIFVDLRESDTNVLITASLVIKYDSLIIQYYQHFESMSQRQRYNSPLQFSTRQQNMFIMKDKIRDSKYIGLRPR